MSVLALSKTDWHLLPPPLRKQLIDGGVAYTDGDEVLLSPQQSDLLERALCEHARELNKRPSVTAQEDKGLEDSKSILVAPVALDILANAPGLVLGALAALGLWVWALSRRDR